MFNSKEVALGSLGNGPRGTCTLDVTTTLKANSHVPCRAPAVALRSRFQGARQGRGMGTAQRV